ncbi:hypothetical protein GCM10011490_22630 [Pseudoclavibacter endophyticus]|nr:hypothetical protein GCM10011490_22630 [Pseudoclavibacter endophyticus]
MQAAGEQFDDATPVLAAHREHEVGVLEDRLRQLMGTMACEIVMIDLVGNPQLHGLGRQGLTDEGMRTHAADLNVQIGEASGKDRRGERRATDVPGAHRQEAQWPHRRAVLRNGPCARY